MGREPGRDEYPSWPLGCGVAFLGLFLSFPIAWLLAPLIAAVDVAPWLARVGPLLAWLAVPLLMLAGWWPLRRQNPYAARVLLWGFAFSLALLAVGTALFDFVDRLSGL